MEQIKDTKKIIEKIEKLLSKSVYSKEALRLKLIKRCDEESLNGVLDSLEKEGTIDEKKFIKLIINELDEKNFGKNSILSYLKRKKYKKENYSSIKFLDSNELKKARREGDLYLPKLDKYSYLSKKFKLTDHLLYKGFNRDISSRVSEEKIIYIKEKELSNLKEEYTKYINKVNTKSYEEKSQNVIRYLLTKGYRYEDILVVQGECKK